MVGRSGFGERRIAYVRWLSSSLGGAGGGVADAADEVASSGSSRGELVAVAGAGSDSSYCLVVASSDESGYVSSDEDYSSGSDSDT